MALCGRVGDGALRPLDAAADVRRRTEKRLRLYALSEQLTFEEVEDKC